MDCPRCGTANPEAARFCHRCGDGLRGEGRTGRGGSFAIQSAENVTQFALISTIMPHTNRRVADTYRWALIVTAAAILGLVAFGLVPAAIVAGAVLVPITYLIYLYDVNLWEDAPVPLVVGLFVVTGILSVLVSLVFFRWAFLGEFAQFRGARVGGDGVSIPIDALLIFAVLLPIVAEVAKQIGPVFLAGRPQFDDMIDGLTFGIAAGTAYAAAETLVVFWPVITGDATIGSGLSLWTTVVLNLMLIKPLIYGTATGIAVAAYSGRGEGYDGFTPSYWANLAFAMGANVLYWLGNHLLSYAAFGELLGMLWGLGILAVLVIRARVLLHTALLEAALEDAAKEHPARGAGEMGWCPECEMPILSGALFCVACGESLRATTGPARRELRSAGGAS
ncbi:MAG: zinc ribbon domain-containing protein [Actinobacteria bacterium]|nr:zinc ribbon domain-containing protein [Actinomycetota bacterium]